MKPHLPVTRTLFVIALALLSGACSPKAAVVAAVAKLPAHLPRKAASTPQPALTEAQLVGVWQSFDPHCAPGYTIIHPGGIIIWSCSPDGSGGLVGSYRLEGSEFIVTSDFCGADGHYQVSPSSGTLTFKVIKDDCAAQVDAFTTQPLKRAPSDPWHFQGASAQLLEVEMGRGRS